MSTKASMNHYLGGQVKVCVFVPYIFFSIILFLSFSPTWNCLSGDGPQDNLRHQKSVSNFTFYHKLPFRCLLPLERPKWNMNTGTSGRRERGKLVGWLERWVLREGSQPFQRKKWLTVSVYIAGRHEHPEVGEERGPEWQKTCQNGDNKQGHPNCVTIKTTKGQKDFWVYCCTFEP